MTLKEAQNYVRKFEQLKRKKVVKNDKLCISCRKNKVSLHAFSGDLEPNYPDPIKQESGMWENGIVFRADAGYGSSHDMDTYFMAVCDKCITELDNEGIIDNKDIIEKEYRSPELDISVERDLTIEDLLDEE